jgi:hypothetical protein
MRRGFWHPLSQFGHSLLNAISLAHATALDHIKR